MSTTFGVRVRSLYDEDKFEEIEVAFRSSYVKWKHPLAPLLPDDTKVIPLDNSAQGIYTIGDIRKVIGESGDSGEKMREVTDTREIEEMRQDLFDLRISEQKNKGDYADRLDDGSLEKCGDCGTPINSHNHCPRCDY